MPASAGACNRYLVNRLICYAYSLSSAPGIVHARFRDVVSVCGKRPFPRCQEQIKLLGVCEMTPYQRLIPFFDSYNRKVTDARNDLRLSLAELSEQSGVSYSAVPPRAPIRRKTQSSLSRQRYVIPSACLWMNCAGFAPRQTSPPCMSLK